MTALTIQRHKQLDVGVQVNGDHQHYYLGDHRIDLEWDEDSQFLTLRLSPWTAESLLIELIASLPKFHKDKG
jgi:hypothetical protein